MAKKIYKGYIDDPRNTDNAWIEAEIWNFHFCDKDRLDELIPSVNIFFKDIFHIYLRLYCEYLLRLQINGRKLVLMSSFLLIKALF